MMDVRELFNRCAATYDRDRRTLVPCFDDFYGTVIRLIQSDVVPSPHILDLGAGTGLLSGLILEAVPEARFTLMDVAESMLDQARVRFDGRAGVDFVVMDHVDLNAESEYDAVVSAVSIHHLTDEEKAALYRRVFRALKPGGLFVNADQIGGVTPEAEDDYQKKWEEDVWELGVTQTVFDQAVERQKADLNTPFQVQMDWLADAGFTGIDCWYKNFRFAVFGGRKAN